MPSTFVGGKESLPDLTAASSSTNVMALAQATVQKLRMELSVRKLRSGNDCNVEKLEKAEVFDELQPLVEELQWSLEAQEQKLEELLTTERSERRAATS
ncbi:unnamed protein product, partial [Durusdinium trenchii]